MSLAEKKWWKKAFQKREHPPREDALKDIEAIMEFIKEAKNDLHLLRPLLEKLEELEKERLTASLHLTLINLETQAKILDQFLQRYEFFQNDVDINGIRVKRIAKNMLELAEKAGMHDLVKAKKKNSSWTFQW